MPDYVVEVYQPKLSADELAHVAARVRIAAGDGPAAHLRSVFVPSDETCFHLFESPSIDAVRDALASAALAYERIVEAIGVGAVPAHPSPAQGENA